MPSLGAFSLSWPLTRGMWGSYGLSLHSNEFSISWSHVRFCQLPTFGSSVIQKFANNTSEMKKLAAHDFKDILQVSFHCSSFCVGSLTFPLMCYSNFWRTFPPSHVQSLLYQFAEWHALVKLRLHSDSTLSFLEETFKKLSQQLQKFWTDTCAAFDTLELLKERAAHRRRFDQHSEMHNVSPESTGPKVKKFNLNTHKFQSKSVRP